MPYLLLETLNVIWEPFQGHPVLLSQGTPLALPSDPRRDLVRGNNTGTPINAAPQTAAAFPALVLSAGKTVLTVWEKW